MISEKHQDHEQLLMRIVTGDELTDSAIAEELFSRCNVCRAEFESMRSIQTALDDDAAELEAVEREPKAPLTEADRHALARLREEVAPTTLPLESEPLRFSKRWALVAALVVAAAGVALWGNRYELRKREETLGSKQKYKMYPVGPVDSFGTFYVERAIPAGYRIEFVICDTNGNPVLPREKLEKAEWKLSEAIVRDWPSAIEWHYVIYNATGDPDETSSTVTASRKAGDKH